MKKFVVSFFSALLLALSFISVIPASAASGSGGGSNTDVTAFKLFEKSFSEHGLDLNSFRYLMVFYYDWSDVRYYIWTFDSPHFDMTDYVAKSFSSLWTADVTFSGGHTAGVVNWRGSNCVYSNMDFYNESSRPNGQFHIVKSNNLIITNNGIDVTPAPPFSPPVNAQFDFKSDIEFFCCLNDNVTSLPVDNRVWIEVYDTLVAVETLVYKPYKYVYTQTITSSSPDVPNKHEQVIGDYLLANSVGPYYSISVDTLLHAGCKTDYYYTARAYVYNGSEPYEIANLTFKISSDGISTVDPSLKDPDHPDDPIMKTWNNDNRTYNYYNVNTGAEVDKDKLVYKFDSSVDPSVNGSGQDISDFDFNSDFSTDLTQGAGLVRTLFDKIIQSAGLSGFMITVLSVAVVGWFIFGSRR